MALYEYKPHEMKLMPNCGANGLCYPDGDHEDLYRHPDTCPACPTTDPRDRCEPESGGVYAPLGKWYHSKVLHVAWIHDPAQDTVSNGCAGRPQARCTTMYWQETWLDADPALGTWQFGEDYRCDQPGWPAPPDTTPQPLPTPGPSPTPPPTCPPGQGCYPQCGYPHLTLNGRPVCTEACGASCQNCPPDAPIVLAPGPLTISFRVPRPANCQNQGYHLLRLDFKRADPRITVLKVRAEPSWWHYPPDDLLPPECYYGNWGRCPDSGWCPDDGPQCTPGDRCPDMGKMYVRWEDGNGGRLAHTCVPFGLTATYTSYVQPLDYEIVGMLQRIEQGCGGGRGFSTLCQWYYTAATTPTIVPSLQARVDYYSERDRNPYRGPANPYRTGGPFMLWNYGEPLHAHPSATWTNPSYPGWSAETRIKAWRYRGSTTTRFIPASCAVWNDPACGWHPEASPVHLDYIHLRWYKYLRPGEREGQAAYDTAFWPYATNPMTVSFSYDVRAETTWTPTGDWGYTFTIPFTQTLTMTVCLLRPVTRNYP